MLRCRVSDRMIAQDPYRLTYPGCRVLLPIEMGKRNAGRAVSNIDVALESDSRGRMRDQGWRDGARRI